MGIKLTASQKEEIRRLTQKANRRILQIEKIYSEAGKEVLPREVTGGIQTRDQWETKGKPLSRSTNFESQKEYRQRINYLRQFDRPYEKGGLPTAGQYTEMQRWKLTQAVETSLGGFDKLPSSVKDVLQNIQEMNPAQIAKFWDRFSTIGARKGPQYSSDAVMTEAIWEFFDEDLNDMVS